MSVMERVREPNGCRYCAIPERHHGTQWGGAGDHVWTPPTPAQIKYRMLQRRSLTIRWLPWNDQRHWRYRRWAKP